MSRARRISLIKELITRLPATTQDTLVEALEDAGISVTQATISRDLAAIGAVRGPHGYRLPNHPTESTPTPGNLTRLMGIIREHVLRIDPAASLVVIHTAPGHANFVATEIDAARPDNMLGCIAGDDTIFIATPSNKAATNLTNQLSSAHAEKS